MRYQAKIQGKLLSVNGIIQMSFTTFGSLLRLQSRIRIPLKGSSYFTNFLQNHTVLINYCSQKQGCFTTDQPIQHSNYYLNDWRNCQRFSDVRNLQEPIAILLLSYICTTSDSIKPDFCFFKLKDSVISWDDCTKFPLCMALFWFVLHTKVCKQDLYLVCMV